MHRNEDFDDMLNSSYETVTICGVEFSPADILAECDPVAYREGMLNYEDATQPDDEPEEEEVDFWVVSRPGRCLLEGAQPLQQAIEHCRERYSLGQYCVVEDINDKVVFDPSKEESTE